MSFLVGCVGIRGWERRDDFGGVLVGEGGGGVVGVGISGKGELEECNMW